MNREKEDELPMMQVNFIDSICLPIYEVSIQVVVIQSKIYIHICFSCVHLGLCQALGQTGAARWGRAR